MKVGMTMATTPTDLGHENRKESDEKKEGMIKG
jgi:hypothetical protein